MPWLRLIRRSTNGLPSILLATLLLFARLLAPAMAMPQTVGAPFSQATICHVGTPADAPPASGHSSQQDCLVCPACHLVSPAVLPMPASPGVALPAMAAIGIAVPLPPATGPPCEIRTTAQPTGPPALSA